MYPADSLAYVEWRVNKENSSAFMQTALNQILNDPQTKRFFSQTGAKLDEVFTKLQPMLGGLDVAAVLGGLGNHCSVGVIPNGQNMPTFLLVVEFPEGVSVAEKAGQMLPRNAQKELRIDLPLQETLMLNAQTAGNLLYVCVGESDAALQEAMKGRESGLGSSIFFQQAAAQLGKNRYLTAYVNLSQGRSLTDAVPDEKARESFKIIVNSCGIPADALCAAYSIAPSGLGFVQRSYVKLPENAPMILKPVNDGILSFVTKDASIYGCGGVSLRQGLLNVLNALPAEELKKVDGLVTEDGRINTGVIEAKSKEIAPLVGLDLWSDVLGQIDGDVAGFLQKSEHLGGASIFGLSGLTMVSKVADAAAMRQKLQAVIAQHAPMLHKAVGKPFTMQSVAGATIEGVAFANALVVSYAFVDGYMLFALNPYAIDYALQQRAAKNTIAFSPEVAQMRKEMDAIAAQTGLTGELCGFARTRLTGLGQTLNSVLVTPAAVGGVVYAVVAGDEAEAKGKMRKGAPGLPFPLPQQDPRGFVEFLGELLPFYLLPPVDVVNTRIFDSWQAVYRTAKNEDVSLTYGPLPMGNIWLSEMIGDLQLFSPSSNPMMIGVMSAMLAGPLMNARASALGVASINNLAQIGKACFMYESMKGMSPQSFDDLLKEGLIEPAILKNPQDGSLEIGYVMIPGNSKDAPANRIIAASLPLENQDGGAVLFKDGHCKPIRCGAKAYASYVQALLKNQDRATIERYSPECSNARPAPAGTAAPAPAAAPAPEPAE